jgi:DNA polymerase-3 subunit alpha
MPDVDFDFADDRRDEMIRFAYNHYHPENVAQIITFGTLGAKAALRDVGRALGMTYAETDRIARLVPSALHITLNDSLEQSIEMKEAYDADARVRRLIDTARRLEGVSRHASTHAAGVVISRDPLIEHVPLQRPNRGDETSIPMTQFAMEQVAKIGLLKMDFLGLSNLTILQRAVDLIRDTTGEEIDLVRIPDGDPETMEMLAKGETFGVFQLESAGMRRYIQELRPTNIADLCAMVALYRPGPMEQIPTFIKAKHGEIEIQHPHPDLANVLDETYGVIVYQDQVLLIARQFAGYSLGQADIMRKAMGKKKAEIMAEEKGRFISGAVANGYSQEDAEAIFALIEPFAGYAFNKAHSWCYGNIAYQTAYLKANYSAQYMAAVLQLTRSAPDTYARIAAAAGECTRLGIEVLAPDINKSQENFSVERRDDGSLAIRFGIGIIKNVGSNAVEGIIAQREKGGVYRDIEDFCKRADLSAVNSRSLEHLVKAGALDCLGERGTLLANVDRILGLAKRERELRESGQSTMFDLFGSQVDTPLPALELEPNEAHREDMLAWEKELLGIYSSEHPFHTAASAVAPYATHALSEISIELAGQTVTVAGMVNTARAATTRDGRKYYITELEDLSGSAELTVWSDTLELTGEEIWAEGRVLVVSLEVRDRGEGRLGLTVRKAAAWDAEGGVAGFAPGQWQVEQSKPARQDGGQHRDRKGPSDQHRGRKEVTSANGTAPTATRANGHTPAPTTEASAPGVQPPVSGESARLTITLYETEDVASDEARLRGVVAMLKAAPGDDPVRLVIHDTEGEETEFDLPRAHATDELVRQVELMLQRHGSVRLMGTAVAGAA